MNRGDGLASGAKSASFTASDKRMTKEQWDAMFEPDVHKEIEKFGEMLDAIGNESEAPSAT